MDMSSLLVLFGGSQENVSYYLGLKETVDRARNCGEPATSFDPRDTIMRNRLQQLQWSPRVILKPFDDIEYLDPDASCKQTAFDQDKEERGESDIEEIDRKIDSPNSVGAEDETSSKDFVCGVNGCSLKFSSLSSYESHYQTSHNYHCSQCRRAFVSDFLLDIHLQENHDSYFQILSTRIDMYRCLVEECPAKFGSPELRKDHLVVTHHFPASFSFHQPLKPKSKNKADTASPNNSATQVGKKQKQPRKKNSSTTEMEVENIPVKDLHSTPGAMETSEHTKKNRRQRRKEKAEGMDCQVNLEEQQSEISRKAPQQSQRRGRGGTGVPSGICFGRGSQRAFRGRGRGLWHEWGQGDRNTKVNIEKMDFSDIKDALQD